MRSKTLIAAAVVSTIGWSAASFAGPSHEVVTPFSPNESGENVFSYQQGFGSGSSSIAMGAMSDHGSGTLSGSYSSSSSAYSTNGGETASIETDANLAAADEGLYSDYYVVGLAPMTDESWNYYVIDDGGTPTVIGLNDFDVWIPDQLVLIPSNSDEMTYELALIPMTFDDSDVTGE